MVKENQRPSLLPPKRAAPAPPDATTRHLTALLDGKGQAKPPKKKKAPQQPYMSDHVKRPSSSSHGNHPVTTSTSTAVRPAMPQQSSAAIFTPKVSGLAVCSLSHLRGANKNNHNIKRASIGGGASSSSLAKKKSVIAKSSLSMKRPSSTVIKSTDPSTLSTIASRVSLDAPLRPARKEENPKNASPLPLSTTTPKTSTTATSLPSSSKMGLQLQRSKRPRYTTAATTNTTSSTNHSEASNQTQASSYLYTLEAREKKMPKTDEIVDMNAATPLVTADTSLNGSMASKASALLMHDLKSATTSSTRPVTNSTTIMKATTATAHIPGPLSCQQEIPRPLTLSSQTTKTSSSNNNGNFVKLNLRNQAGACRGARNKSSKKFSHSKSSDYSQYNTKNKSSGGNMMSVGLSGTDPVDDFVDGVFRSEPETTTTTTRGTTATDTKASKRQHQSRKKSSSTALPLCSGHQLPCKLLTVKKNTENKGRQFYCCAIPRHEQPCNHFEWADDTTQAAQFALLKNSSTSGFIARQVAAYMVNVKQLTVPELQALLKRHGLAYQGKKDQLLTRMAIWVRDQVAGAVKEKGSDATVKDEDGEEPEDGYAESCNSDEDNSDSSSESENDSDDSSISSEELEIVGGKHASNSRIPALSREMERNDRSDLEEDGDDDSSNSADSEHDGNMLHLSHSTLRKTLKQLFGHSEFRQGQEWAIRRCLNHKRTLLVAPTGFGKSLCYTMTAALMDGVCIVVSPLLSLIQDQLRLLPPGVPAVTLSGNMTKSKMVATLDDIARGRIKIVFVSPERLTSASFRRLFRWKWNTELQEQERVFPNVSLLCVDEAHCLSQWAHHFRPSYLRLRSMLTWIQPQSVLAITATAGPKVVQDICQTLGIRNEPSPQRSDESPAAKKTVDDNDCGVHVMKSDRDNIDVSCYVLSTQEERLDKLMTLLKPKGEDDTKTSDQRAGVLSKGSVIIYVWRQRDAEAIAENIQAANVRGGVTVYHGGMDAAARSKAQSKFLRGKIRICVATIAFGLGINKEDVVGVVHMYLSASPEHFLQEIGRAGRNGQPAHAVALILDDEVLIRHSLGHSDLLSESQVRFFLHCLAKAIENSLALIPENRIGNEPIHVGLTVSACINNCDCRAETIETLVSLLELRDESLVQVEGWFYDLAHVAPKRRSLQKLATQEPIARAILDCATCTEPPAGDQTTEPDIDLGATSSITPLGQRIADNSFGSYCFSVAQCANCLGSNAEPRHVFATLRRLEQRGDIDFVLETSEKARALNLKVSVQGLHQLRTGSDAIDHLTNELADRLNSIATTSCNKVVDLDYILRKVALCSSKGGSTQGKSESLHQFQTLIRQYFESEGQGEMLAPELPPFSDVDKYQIMADIQSTLSRLSTIEESLSKENNSLNLTVRDHPDYASLVITKFMHGIQATARCLPSLMWQHALFGRMQSSNFTDLCDTVRKIISN